MGLDTDLPAQRVWRLADLWPCGICCQRVEGECVYVPVPIKDELAASGGCQHDIRIPLPPDCQSEPFNESERVLCFSEIEFNFQTSTFLPSEVRPEAFDSERKPN